MAILMTGLLLWVVVHFIPSLAQPLKARWIQRTGPMGYQGSFALMILLSVVLIVIGWRSTVPETVYVLPAFSRHLAMLLMLLAFILMGASHAKTRIKRMVRHPQLTGLMVWAVAHLLVNGDTRSILLFGCLGLWAFFTVIAINRREGDWQKTEAPNMAVEIRGLLISFAIFIAAAFAHRWFTGVPLF